MSSQLRGRVEELVDRIGRLDVFFIQTKVHCSKINSLLRSYFLLLPMLEPFVRRKKGREMRKAMKALKRLNEEVEKLEAFCVKCSDDGPGFPDFVIYTPIKDAFETLFHIRQMAIAALTDAGLTDAVNLFVSSPAALLSQNHVDLKKLLDVYLRYKKSDQIKRMPKAREALESRLDSLKSHGLYTQEGIDAGEFVDVPQTNDFIMSHDQLQCKGSIGSGRSASVCKGTITGCNEVFAFKILHERSLCQNEKEALKREIKILASLSHDSLLRFRGYTAETPFFIVTDYLANGSLYDFLKRRPSELSGPERTRVARDIASGMAYMHSLHMIHRDLKSLNILLDSDKRAKVCDFGLSRFASCDPMSGSVGTPQWMAPEILLCEPSYDAKVDVYSFGIVLWELLTSERPFLRIACDVLPRMIIEDGLRPPIPQNTPPELVNLITGCWSGNSALRPSFERIEQLLCLPAYEFPSMDASAKVQPVARRQTLTRLKSDDAFMRLSKPIDSYLVQIYGALHHGSDDVLERTISNMRREIAQNGSVASPNEYVEKLMRFINETKAYRRLLIIRLLIDSFSSREVYMAFLEEKGAMFLCNLLETKDPDTVNMIMGLLEKDDSASLVIVPTMLCLFTFSDYEVAETRHMSLSILLKRARAEKSVFVEHPDFIATLLDFTRLMLNESLYSELLDVASSLLSERRDITSRVVSSLSHVVGRVPRIMWPRAVALVVENLRFPELAKEFPDSYWIMAGAHFDVFRIFFTSFMSVTPGNPETMIRSIVDVAATNADALGVLVAFAKIPAYAPLIAASLPITTKDLTALAELYLALIESGGVADVICSCDDFYFILQSLLGDSFTDDLYQLLKCTSIDIDKLRSSGCIDAVIQVISTVDETNDCLWKQLDVVHQWWLRYQPPEFEALIPVLTKMLSASKSRARVGSFLCLTKFADVWPDKVPGATLLKLALGYVSGWTECIQTQSVDFLEKNRAMLAPSLLDQAVADFLKYLEETKASIAVARLLVGLVREADISLPAEAESRLVHLSNL